MVPYAVARLWVKSGRTAVKSIMCSSGFGHAKKNQNHKPDLFPIYTVRIFSLTIFPPQKRRPSPSKGFRTKHIYIGNPHGLFIFHSNSLEMPPS
ncbi:hypothetical protein A0H81_01013 [Grifola frondosa]|uniref:Uncharacterized protein n=1 Tax=Grifola frondosa TaxID=5627 RepID=A0A1C7MRI5_GRIFR|nr:hypothetical protein A0H81_01013 [Grifola frondosa]